MKIKTEADSNVTAECPRNNLLGTSMFGFLDCVFFVPD